MSKVEKITPVETDLKPINEDILAFGNKLVAKIHADKLIKDNGVEVTNEVFIESLPEGVDEKQAKAFMNYMVTARNGVSYAAKVLGIEHMKDNADAPGFTVKMKSFGRDHITAKINRGTSAEDAGNITVDVQHYDVGRNMGQQNLIVKHANAAARDALKFD